MSWAQRILAVAFLALSPALAHATTNCDLASGASISAIQAAVSAGAGNTCTVAGNVPNGHTVFFQAGNFSISSQVPIPCPTASGLLITGPTPAGLGTAWPLTPAAILTSSISGNWAFSGAACANGTTIRYLQYNGSEPSGGGGGFLYVAPGMNNLTVQYNLLFGVSAIQQQSHPYDSMIWFDGSDVVGSTRTQNINVTWNQIGKPNSNDCANLMNAIGGVNSCVVTINGGGYNLGGSGQCWYQDSDTEKNVGGYCAGIGVHVNFDNLNFSNNSFAHLEQGMKFHEGCTPFPCPDEYKPTNATITNNDFTQIHRIVVEGQSGGPGPWTITGNSLHDEILFGGVSWGWSLPQGGTASASNLNTQHVISNLIIDNSSHGTDKYGARASRSYGVEYWDSAGTVANNLIQGIWGGGVDWGYGGPTWSINNNNFQQLTTLFVEYIGDEESTGKPPSISGNAFSHIVSVANSVAPSISPTPTGTYSSPIAVTITDNGYTSGTLPLGNTSIYYTTDGSTPTTASPWCRSPCSISVSPGTTVNAIGMWGDLNQPRSYAAGYGFVPSAVMGAHYSAGATPTLTGVSLSIAGGGASLQTGNSVQACATATYTGVAPVVTCGNGADTYGTTFGSWTTSAGGVATISGSGSVIGVAAGSTNLGVKATQGATNFTSLPFSLAVSNPTPVLTGVTITDGGVGTIGSTQSVQASATSQYTNGPAQNCVASPPDSFGTTCGTWLSSNNSVATISTSGLIQGVAGGSATFTVKATAAGGSPSFTSATPLAITVTGTPPVATLTGVTVTGCSAVQAGNTVNCGAQCAYSVGPATDCTTMDSHGTLANSWASATPAAATINSTTGVASGVAAGTTSITVHAGSFTSPGFTLTVSATPPVTLFLGNSNFDTAGQTSPNVINATYAVTGTNPGGYTASSCTFYLPTGTYTAGSKWDCGLVRAPTSTTQATSWLCANTYTNTGTAADVGWHTVSLGTCGVLPTATAYWVDVNTNHPGRPGEGFTSCGGSACNGPAPTIGNGTFPCAFVSANYGVYTGMDTAMTSGCGAPGVQASQYVTLNSPLPTFAGAYLGNPGPTIILSPGGGVQFSAFCQYSDGTVYLCYPTPDQYGNTVTAWTSSAPSVVTIGDIGSAHPGMATGMTVGTANIQATITGGHPSATWGLIVSSTPLPYPPTKPRGVGR